MSNWKQNSEEELVRIGREALRALRFERARDAFAEYTARVEDAGRMVPAGIQANYAFALGHSSSLKEGIRLCRAALKSDRRVPEVYYCLAQLYLLDNARKQAWETLRQGLSFGPAHAGLLELEGQMGVRRHPALPFLDRKNPLNVRLGKALRRRRKSSPRVKAAAF
jgi:tetratricopeptide (TPR) repeat protein